MSALWQRACIALARSERLRDCIQASRMLTALSARFVSGADVAAALAAVERLRQAGRGVSLFYLGEYVADPGVLARNVRELEALIGQADLRLHELHVSVDPSAIGYAVSDELGQANALALGRALRDANVSGRKALMLDMEDHSYVECTLALHDRLRSEGVPAAVTLQAYLHRSADDACRLASSGAYVRLVKGAFAGQRPWAHTRRADIDAAYLRLAETLLAPAALAAGTRPSFATHDDRLIGAIADRLRERSVSHQACEFEMLLGVREPLQARLVGEGHPVRVYLPYGTDWWPYTVRRIGENPANVRFVFSALFRR